jgi:hypothetical protein
VNRRTKLTTPTVGVIAQLEAAKVIILGTLGRLSIGLVAADDEERDLEVRVRGRMLESLWLQCKATMHLSRQSNRTQRLQRQWDVDRRRLRGSQRLYYLFGYLDPKTWQFVNPLFLVPSEVLHRHARPARRRGWVTLRFHASMDPKAHDQWSPYRVSVKELGPRILEIIEKLDRTRPLRKTA